MNTHELFNITHALLTGVGIGVGLMLVVYSMLNWSGD
jgi:hypothetical protein